MDVAVVVSALVGLLVSPILVLMIDRIPGREPLFDPRLNCRECHTERSWLDQVPLLGWFRAGGHCRHCGAGWGPEPLVVPVASAVLFGLAGWRFGATWVLIPFLVFFASLVVGSAIDVRHLRLPDLLVFPTLALSLVMIAGVSLIEGHSQALTFAGTGAVAFVVPLFLMHIISPKGMGFGDVKFGLVLGLFVGWIAGSWISAVQLVIWALMIGSLSLVVVGLPAVMLRGRKVALPFGPALALGSAFTVLFTSSIPGIPTG
ncbi:MAG: prepilin peptidase [Actinomycetia bacterium]|nr:prepilin peptidase [Actinomycetes bacterium]